MNRNAFWCGSNESGDDWIHLTSCISKLLQVPSGDRTEKTLMDDGFLKLVTKLADLMPIDNDVVKRLFKLKGIGKGKIDAWMKKVEEIQVELAVAEAAQAQIDHRLRPHPYWSKRGKGEGEKRT